MGFRQLGLAGWLCVGLVLALAGTSGIARANVFSMPTGQASLDMVTVGDPGNAADTRYVTAGVGAVGYTYQMGKFDVTAGQYAEFLNATASAADPYGLYNPFMANTSSSYVGCGITRSSTGSGYSYSVISGRENFPVNYVSWGDAVRFANWLSNGQGSGSTEVGSYTLNGATDNAGLMAVTRNPGATFVLPTEDEWYKPAYYKGGSTDAGYWTYPTRSDTTPSNVLSGTGTNNANFAVYVPGYGDVYTSTSRLTPVGAFAGSPGPYGTFDQGGDVSVWLQNEYFEQFRGSRGASYGGYAYSLQPPSLTGQVPSEEGPGGGFRVALVPEPISLALLALCGTALLMHRRSMRAQ